VPVPVGDQIGEARLERGPGPGAGWRGRGWDRGSDRCLRRGTAARGGTGTGIGTGIGTGSGTGTGFVDLRGRHGGGRLPLLRRTGISHHRGGGGSGMILLVLRIPGQIQAPMGIDALRSVDDLI